MRVVQLFFQLHARGGERVAYDLFRNFTAEGHPTTNLGFWYRDDLRSEATEHFELLSPDRRGTLGALLGSARLVRRLRLERADALLMHSTAGGLLGGLAGFLARVPKRVMIHHNPLGTYQSNRWTMLDALWGATGIYTHIVFISEGGVRSASNLPRQYRRRVRLVLNGVDPISAAGERDFRHELGVHADDHLLVSVGSLTGQKNHQLAIDAIAQSGLPCAYLVAGEGPLENDLREQAARSGVRLELLGHLDAGAVGDLLSQADLFVFPSVHEGRPLTLLEAAHAGAPVLASSISANSDTLGSAAEYAELDVSAFSAALTKLFETPGYLEELRDRSRSFDARSTKEMANEYLTILVSPTGRSTTGE